MYSDDNLIVSKGSKIRDKFKAYFNSHYYESPDSGEVGPGVYEFLGLKFVKDTSSDGFIEIEISSP